MACKSIDFMAWLSFRLKMADNTVILLPFAINSADRETFVIAHDAKKVNYTSGIPQAFEVSPETGGCAVTRNIFNEIGYESSLGGFFWQTGACLTFNQAVSDKIGGYPQGAILKDFSNAFDDNGEDYAIVRDVISLQDNNTKNFVYSRTNPEPYEIGTKDENGIVWWDYVDSTDDESIYAPNYVKREQITTLNCNGSNSYTWTSNVNGWILIKIHAEGINGWLEGATPSFPLLAGAYIPSGSSSRKEISEDAHPSLPKIAKDAIAPVSSKVYYYGYSDDQNAWNGRLSNNDTEYMIYSSENGEDIQFVFPTNIGIVHKIFAYLESNSPILNISVYSLDTFSEVSEDD